MRFFLLLILLLSLTLESCLVLDGTLHAKELRSLSLQPEENSELRKAHQATISTKDSRVIVTVPDYVDPTRLVPSIGFEGVAISLDGQPWIAGQAVDFTRLRSIDIYDKDDEPRRYTVDIRSVPASSDKTLRSYAAIDSRLENNDIGSWPRREISDTDDLWEITIGTDDRVRHLASVSVVFDHNGAAVSIDGLAGSGIWRHVDLTVPHTITVTAEDLSTATWTLRVQYASRLDGSFRINPMAVYGFALKDDSNVLFILPHGFLLSEAELNHHQAIIDETGILYPSGTQVFDFTHPRTFLVPATYISRSFTITARTAM